MSKWRTRVVEIEATLWTGENVDRIKAFIDGATNVWFGTISQTLHIETPEGVMTAQPGDMIIRGLKGEFYSCKPDMFRMKYEPAEATHD